MWSASNELELCHFLKIGNYELQFFYLFVKWEIVNRKTILFFHCLSNPIPVANSSVVPVWNGDRFFAKNDVFLKKKVSLKNWTQIFIHINCWKMPRNRNHDSLRIWFGTALERWVLDCWMSFIQPYPDRGSKLSRVCCNRVCCNCRNKVTPPISKFRREFRLFNR